MAVAQDPFTLATLSTIGGATLACTVVPNVLGKVFAMPDRGRAGVALLLALVIQLVVAANTEGERDLGVWVVAILNGFLVAAAALGLNEATPGGGGGGGGGNGGGGGDDGDGRRFRASWV